MKPVFYFIENPTVANICDQFGPYLEKLSTANKLEVIGFLGLWLSELEGSEAEDLHWKDLPIEADPENDVRVILNQCNDLEPGQVVDFMAAIVEVTAV